MNRKEAEALIGKQVRVWTAANGEYVGTLESLHGKPWRGVVRITGIISVAQHYERGATCRRGFRVGETIEAGNSSIRPTDLPGNPSYLAVLEETIAEYQQKQEKCTPSPHNWVWPAFIKAMQEIALVEQHRLETGCWKPNEILGALDRKRGGFPLC